MALLRSQYWTREAMLRHQEERIGKLLKSAVRIPVWKDVLEKAGVDVSRRFHLSDLQKLPITLKKDIWKTGHSKEHYVNSTLVNKSVYERTSGSTGIPLNFYHDRHHELRSFAICERMFRTAAGGPRLHFVTARKAERMGFVFTNYSFFYLRSYSSLRHRLPQLKELIESVRGGKDVILFGWTSAMIELARLLKEQGTSLPIRAIITGGETLSEKRRNEVVQATGAGVFRLYAASEVGRIASDCEHGRLHINEEWMYVEIVDEFGISVPDEKEGRVIVTDFDNLVMPFIRYDVGDLAFIEKSPCACGRTSRTLQVRGRQIHLLAFPDGRTVSSIEISAPLETHADAILQFQVIRTATYAFTVLVVPGPRFEIMKDRIGENLARLIHPHVNISWEVVEDIEPMPSGKTVNFINRMDADHV